jgi:hypothetical protein
MRWIQRSLMLAVILAAGPTLMADDITGASAVLCTAVEATVCAAEGDCMLGPPWNWDIPQFIIVDLGLKELRTTPASGENRKSPIKNMERADGYVFLQGVENGRAFSLAIEEETGLASVAVARQGITVSVFGACTPYTAR